MLPAFALGAVAAAAQRGQDCTLVINVYPDSTRTATACAGEGGTCLDWYWECDGQPYPAYFADYRSEPGHLANSPFRVTSTDTTDTTDLRDDLHVRSGADAQLALTAPFCESRDLFDRLDRIRKSNPSAEAVKTRSTVDSAVAAPVAP